PFVMRRAGDARIAPPPVSAPIGKAFEGTWNGTLDVDGWLEVVLEMSNHPDGTSTGAFVSVREGLKLPVVLTQQASRLTVNVPMVGWSYTATIDAAGTELSGTYTTAKGHTIPLNLRRAT